MHIVHLYTGDDQQSHFADIEVAMEAASYGQLSELISTEGFKLRELPAGGELDFHNAPRRQFLVTLEGSAEIELGDGTKRVLGPGAIMLADDTTGQGHITREVDSPRRGLLLPVADDFDVESLRG